MTKRTSPDARPPGDARFERIVELAADAIICIDGGQRITLFNAGASKTFGYAPAEIIGERLDVLIPERFQRGHRMKVSNFAGGAPTARHMGERSAIFARRKDGEEFPADATISKIEVGGETVLTVVLRDVSERFRIEEQRRLDAERLRYALHAGHLGSYVHDLSTGHVALIGRTAEILGLQGDAIDFDAWVARVHEDDADLFRAFAARTMHDHANIKVEYRTRDADGAVRWIQVAAEPGDHNGDRHRRFGIVRDITEQKALQQVLEERVAARTEELQEEIRQREEAQRKLVRVQRMEVYGQLTGGVAHDFNNLLTVIGGNLELLEDHVAGERPQRLLRRAIEAVAMGARLTQRLLTFARRGKLEPQVLDLNEQVVGVIDLLRRTIGEAITISSVLAPDLGRVRADPSEVENAILNLAINARDAMPAGGNLIIETANATIDDASSGIAMIEAIAPGQYVRLSVTDTGSGMTQDVLARAFEPFFTTKEHGKGTGLGLATIYGFVRQSNGHATIQSQPGKGTTVNILLPRTDEERAVAAAAGGHPDGGGLRKCILVVEDNPDVRAVTTARLEKLGYRVVSCESGPAAVAALDASADIDLVFSDIMMAGGMSGYDLAGWLAANRPGKGILLTSGFEGAGAALAATAHPALKVLRKPYSSAELAREIGLALGD